MLKAYILRHLPIGATSAISDPDPAKAAREFIEILDVVRCVEIGVADDASSTSVICSVV